MKSHSIFDSPACSGCQKCYGVTSSNPEVTIAERNITLIGHKHSPDSPYSIDSTITPISKRPENRRYRL